MKNYKKRKIENDVRKKDFIHLLDMLSTTYDDREGKESLQVLYYYLLQIRPSYGDLVNECNYLLCDLRCAEFDPDHYKLLYNDDFYWKYLLHMGKLCVFIHSRMYADASREIEDIYYCLAREKYFFQPKYVYNILKILSHIGGKYPMLIRMEDEYSFEEMTQLVSLYSKEIRSVRKKFDLNKPDRSKLSQKTSKFKCENYNSRCKSVFSESMRAIKDMISWAEEIGCSQTVLIDYLSDIIKNDLKYDYLANVIYGRELTGFRISFPHIFYDEHGNIINLDNRTYEEVDFSKVLTFSIPWNRRRVVENLANLLNKDFQYHKNNHQAVYFPQLDMCFATSGNHSIAVGVKKMKGKLWQRYLTWSRYLEILIQMVYIGFRPTTRKKN